MNCNFRMCTQTEIDSLGSDKVFAKNEIYPDIWSEPLDQCLDQYVLGYFEVLKEFIAGTRDAGNGMIVYMT